MSYILITPIKDEAESLPQLKKTILEESLLPVLWVLVDGGSKDGSFHKAENLFCDFEWIKIINQRVFVGANEGYKNMSAAINEGYEFAKKHCAETHNAYTYIGKTDATPILQSDYFETLHAEMENDPKLAFCCGIERLKYGTKTKDVRPMRNFSSTGWNDVRLYRKEFFDEIGGYPLTPCPDSVVQLKAAHRGWTYKIVERTYYVEPRLGGARVGFWAGNKRKGKSLYELGYHPFMFLLHTTYDTVTLPPHYHIMPQTLGYLSSAVRREKKVDDDEIRDYFWRERLREVLNEFL